MNTKNAEIEGFGKAEYPKNWPNLGVSGHLTIKSILRIFEFPKMAMCFSPKFNFC